MLARVRSSREEAKKHTTFLSLAPDLHFLKVQIVGSTYSVVGLKLCIYWYKTLRLLIGVI